MIGKNNQRSGVSTFANRYKPTTDQSLQKSFHLYRPIKIVLKKFFPFKNFKNAYTQIQRLTKNNMTITAEMKRFSNMTDKNRQHLTACSFNCRDSKSFSVSAFNKLLCNLTGKCLKSATESYTRTVMGKAKRKTLRKFAT